MRHRRHPSRSHGEVQGTVRSNGNKQIGTIGDVNFPEYDGGPVYDRGDGTFFLEYVETPADGLDFGNPKSRWTVYSVELDRGVPSWGNLKDVARTSDQDPKELKDAFESDDPMQRAWAYETWATHYGWHEFDSYPLTLTCAETSKRYDTDLGCYSDIHTALEEVVEEMADESSASAWSYINDQLQIDLEDEGYDPQSIVNIAEFGDTMAVNGDVLVDPSWERSLGLPKAPHPRLWSEIGSGPLETLLEKEGHEYTDKGGRIPVAEGYASGEAAVAAVAQRLKLPEETVQEAANALDWWQEEIPRSTSGSASIWAKKFEGARDRRKTRRS